MMAEYRRLFENTSREVGAQMDRLTARAMSSDGRVAQLETELEFTRYDLQKMKEIVAGNEMQRLGVEKKMNDLQDHIFSIHDQLQKSAACTSLHQLALECSVKSSIPAHPDETSLTSALGELATKMEAIPSKHAARVSEEISSGIHTRVCHVLACVKLALPNVDLKEILSTGVADATREDVMAVVADLGETVLPLFEE
jgi:chromosome segregation ATPase